MLTARPSSFDQKRDLHVGGLGAHPSGALAAVTDRLPEGPEAWLGAARNAARDAESFVRANPWASLAAAALAGLAAGYLLSQRNGA